MSSSTLADLIPGNGVSVTTITLRRCIAVAIWVLVGCGRLAAPPAPHADLPLPLLYPEILRGANVEGVVVLDLVLDSLGRYDRQRSHVVRETNKIFSQAVWTAIDSAARMSTMHGDRRFTGIRRDTFAFILHSDRNQICPPTREQWMPVCAVMDPPQRFTVP